MRNVFGSHLEVFQVAMNETIGIFDVDCCAVRVINCFTRYSFEFSHITRMRKSVISCEFEVRWNVRRSVFRESYVAASMAVN